MKRRSSNQLQLKAFPLSLRIGKGWTHLGMRVLRGLPVNGLRQATVKMLVKATAQND